jgi:hypothetical protein
MISLPPSRCKNSGIVKVPDVNSYIQVLDGQTPKITIGGIKSLAKKEEELEKIGQQIFPNLIIMTSMGTEKEEETKEKTAERFASYLFKSKVFANAGKCILWGVVTLGRFEKYDIN